MTHATILVNWKGAEDTIACVESLRAGGDRGLVVVVDNGSGDGSVKRLRDAFGNDALLVDAGENLGFAAGCNLGLKHAMAAGCTTAVFLNNDTIVEGDAVERLVRRLHACDSSVFATLPMLTVHGTDRIWNCGGRASALGLRRYHLAGRPRGEARGLLRCSFFTGCCFAVRAADFAARGGFSERFFFGEEDFELALWMKSRGLHALCDTEAVVQHKVSASFSAAATAGDNAKVFVYYLNRFIHMRLRLGELRWRLWAAAYLPYVAALLWRSRGMGPRALRDFIARLMRHAGRMDRVTRADFEAAMQGRL